MSSSNEPLIELFTYFFASVFLLYGVGFLCLCCAYLWFSCFDINCRFRFCRDADSDLMEPLRSESDIEVSHMV
jgi:hypothetical protein